VTVTARPGGPGSEAWNSECRDYFELATLNRYGSLSDSEDLVLRQP
jgi:hypothetical protein